TRNDARDTAQAVPDASVGDGEPVAVGRNEANLLRLKHEQHAVQRKATLIVRDREARLSQHLAKRLGLKGQPRRWRGRYHRRKIVGRQADEAIVDTGTAQVDGGTLAHFQRETSRRSLLHVLGELELWQYTLSLTD